MKILVVAAHPDDEVLGCGGTIARLALEGHLVCVAILGEGITSRCSSSDQADQEQLRKLQACSRHVAKFLGVSELFQYNFPDNRFDTIPLLEIVKHIEGIVQRIGPDIVYTQHGGDLNVDHAITFRATLTATRPLLNSSIRAVYAYEVPSSTEWSFQRFEPIFRPTVFRNISKTLAVKLEAMRMYGDEGRPFPHPRSAENLQAVAQHWGSVAGLQAAEAFELIREVA